MGNEDRLIIGIYDGCWIASVLYGSTYYSIRKDQGKPKDPVLLYVVKAYDEWKCRRDSPGKPFVDYLVGKGDLVITKYDEVIVVEDGQIERSRR